MQSCRRKLEFDRHWPKLDNFTFTTFRYPKQDEWQVNEIVQVLVTPKNKPVEYCGFFRILSIDKYDMDKLTDSVAREDGFIDAEDMMHWLKTSYDRPNKLMNKLTLEHVAIWLL